MSSRAFCVLITKTLSFTTVTMSNTFIVEAWKSFNTIEVWVTVQWDTLFLETLLISRTCCPLITITTIIWCKGCWNTFLVNAGESSWTDRLIVWTWKRNTFLVIALHWWRRAFSPLIAIGSIAVGSNICNCYTSKS